MKLTDLEAQLICHLEHYHRGQSKATSSKELEVAFSIKGTELRQMVNKLRSEDYPICSDANGYYYPACIREVQATAAQLNSRIVKIAKAKSGLMKYINENTTDKEV